MTTIKNRRGTAAQWAAVNPVLADGELGFERDTNQIKIGNGVGHWLELFYFFDQTHSTGGTNTSPWALLSDPTYAGGLKTTNTAAANDAVLNAAIASGKTLLIAPFGIFKFAALHNFGNCDLIGMGGGFGFSGTTFKATAGNASFNFDGGGSTTGGFRIDGDGVSYTPFRRQPTTAASSSRTFRDITVLNNADDGSGTNPLVALIGNQNDTFDHFTAYASVHDIMLLDGGCGGLTFINMELAQAGRSHIRFDNQITVSEVYTQPANINFYGGRCEGTVGLGSLYFNAGASITFYNVSLFSTNKGTGPLIDVVNATDITFDSGWYQEVGAPGVQAGSVGLAVRGNSSVSLAGGQRWANFNNVFLLDGTAASLDMKQSGHYYSCNIRINLLNGAALVQCTTFIDGTLFVRSQYDNTPVLISYNPAQNGLDFQILNNGHLQWFSRAAGGFTVESTIGRLAAGIVGMQGGAFAHAQGNTANRPPNPTPGTAYFNTDLKALETYDGTGWTVPVGDFWNTEIDVASPQFDTGGTVSVLPLSSPAIPGAVIAYNPTAAVNDYVTWKGSVCKGTWTVRCWFGILSSGGIVNIDYSLDGGTTWVAVSSALDLYSATAASGSVDKTGIVVTSQKTILIRWKVTGKNASSASNSYLAGKMFLTRTI